MLNSALADCNRGRVSAAAAAGSITKENYARTPLVDYVLTLKGSSYRLKDTGIDTLPSARADNTTQ